MTAPAEQDVQQAAIVTGAGSGMGYATAARLAAAGWCVLAVDVQQDSLAALVDKVGAGIVACPVDITDRDALEAAIATALPDEYSLTAVINAAGIYPPTTLADVNEATYRRIFDVNVLGTLNTIAAAVPYLRKHAHGGAIVNFASIDALSVSPGQLLYSASKAAIVSITRSLAIELAPDGIVVNGVAPGWVDTPGNRATGRMDAALAAVPLRRAAAPDEIVDWVLSLCRRGSYMTGETLVIAGGIYMR